MRFWYLSHRRPAKAQASLRIREISPQPSLFAHMKYGSRRRVRQKFKTPSPTGWLRMRIWRMNLRRTKCAIMSWAGSFHGKSPWKVTRTAQLDYNSDAQLTTLGVPAIVGHFFWQSLSLSKSIFHTRAFHERKTKTVVPIICVYAKTRLFELH